MVGYGLTNVPGSYEFLFDFDTDYWHACTPVWKPDKNPGPVVRDFTTREKELAASGETHLKAIHKALQLLQRKRWTIMSANWSNPGDLDPRVTQFSVPRHVHVDNAVDDQPQSETGETSVEKVQVRLQPMFGTPTPLLGQEAAQYERNDRKQISDPHNPNYLRVPNLSKLEWQIRDDEGRRLRDIADYNQHLQETEAARLQAIVDNSVAKMEAAALLAPTGSVAFLNTKGDAGTTKTQVNCSIMLSDTLRPIVVSVDANPAHGTSAAEQGKDLGETITFQEIAEERMALSRIPKEFLRRARPNKYSVRVVGGKSTIEKNKRLNRSDWRDVLAIVQAYSDYDFVDTANDITGEETLEILEHMDLFVFTAWADEPNSLRQLGTSMQSLRQHGFEEKVDNAVVVITGIHPGVDVNSYRKFLHGVNMRDEVVEEYPEFRGPFLSVQHDAEIAKATEANKEAWQWQTAEDYRQVDIAILQGLAAAPERTPLSLPVFFPEKALNGHAALALQ